MRSRRLIATKMQLKAFVSMLHTVDLITPCRNRTEYLLNSLSSWLGCRQIRRVIVVDFNSTVPVSLALGDFAKERITVVRVDDEPLWRQGRAQNVGLALVEADLVLKVDVDVSILDIDPYVKEIGRSNAIYFRGFHKWGTSSGLCLAPTTALRAIGGYHDHMSGWGGDDVDLCRRLAKLGLKRQFVQPESFQEQKQHMTSKNSEAPTLDTELLGVHGDLASNPYFTAYRNLLLSRIQRQTHRRALRWCYSPMAVSPETHSPGRTQATQIRARLFKPRGWRMKMARHATELANILAVAYFERTPSPWELMRSEKFRKTITHHQLPSFQGNRERKLLLQQLPYRMDALRALASEMGVTCRVQT